VTGTSIDTRITESGETTGPTEGYTVAALVGSTKIPGTVHADGSFTISGVPAGVFTLEVTTSDGVTLFVVTAERTFDLGSVIQGRADKANATRTTNVTLALTGAAPWISTDELNFYSLGADAWDEFNFDATPPPHVGATSIGGRLDYEFAFSPGLVDTAKGDVPYLVDLVTTPLSGVPVTAAAKVFSPTSLTMQDGHAAAIAGAFVDVPQTSHATISWKRSAFAAFADAAFPGATLVDHELSFFAEPAGPGRQSDGGSAVLVDALDTASTDVDLPIDFGNPLPRLVVDDRGRVGVLRRGDPAPWRRHGGRLELRVERDAPRRGRRRDVRALDRPTDGSPARRPRRAERRAHRRRRDADLRVDRARARRARCLPGHDRGVDRGGSLLLVRGEHRHGPDVDHDPQRRPRGRPQVPRDRDVQLHMDDGGAEPDRGHDRIGERVHHGLLALSAATLAA
jgi:hypothetical protein